MATKKETVKSENNKEQLNGLLTQMVQMNIEPTEAVEKEVEKVADNAQSERVLRKEELTMKQRLEAEEQVDLLIPYDSLNPDDVVPIGLNGVTYLIPRGKSFKVPKPIADIWKYSYEKTLEAENKARKLMEREIVIR